MSEDLPGAVIADDGEDLARIEVEICIVERGHASITLDETAGGENGFDSHGHTETFLIH